MSLSNDQIRVKVAELLGAKWRKYGSCIALTFDPKWGTVTTITEDAYVHPDIPDYPLSLDACAEGFENGMTDDQHKTYRQHLWKMVLKEHPFPQDFEAFREVVVNGVGIQNRLYLSATAKQRCLAFIATMEGK